MKNIQYLLGFIFCMTLNLFANAQEETADYKKYEKLAKKINDIQRTANGKSLKTDNEDVSLKIPEQNFIFSYHDFTVSNIHRAANENGEVSMIYENIDLANIEDIGILDESYGDCGMIILTPSKQQNYKIVVNDEVQSHEIENIAFYFLNSDRDKGKEMFNALVDLIYFAKIKKASFTELQAKTIIKTWKETEKKNTAEDYYKFWNDLPQNLFTSLAYYKLGKLDKSFNIGKLNIGGYKLGMTKDEFEDMFYKKLKSFTTTDPLVQEAIKNYKISYYHNTEKNEYSTVVYIAKENSGIPNRKLNKNTEIQKLIQEQKSLYAKDFLPGLVGFHLSFEKVTFDSSSNKVKELEFSLPLNSYGENSKDKILANAISHFGNVKYKNKDNTYYSIWGPGDSELTLTFYGDDCGISLSNK